MLGWMIFEFLFGFAIVMCIKNGETNDIGFAIFVMFFIVITVVLISTIVKKIINLRTSLVGVETYGLVERARKEESHTKRTRIVTWYVDVILQDEAGNILRCTECIGETCKYGVGEFVRLKHCKNDINLLDVAGDWEVSESLRNRLTSELNKPGSTAFIDYSNPYGNSDEKIIIDGVVYRKK